MKHEVIDGCSNHEQVHFFQDECSGLKALIAIHDTTLGLAMGGCRMWPYDTFDSALIDVLRLSQGMTYKCAMADLPIGGGKSVIIGDPAKHKNHDLLKSMAHAIDYLNGRYIAAEDSGTSVRDMKIMQLYTPYIAGVDAQQGRLWEQSYGDPSPATAYGTFMGIKASVLYKLGREDLNGLKVNVQGLGNVGLRVARYLVEAGAIVRVHDRLATRERNIVAELGVEAVSADDIINRPADIFCPCALGAIIDEKTVERLNVAIVAGAANNQLASEEQGQRLLERGILYAPDFVINAGGIIDAGLTKLDAHYRNVNSRVNRISETLLDIYKRADADNLPTDVIAVKMAKEKMLCAHQSQSLNVVGSSPVESYSTDSQKPVILRKPGVLQESGGLRKKSRGETEGRNLVEEVARRFKVPNAYN